METIFGKVKIPKLLSPVKSLDGAIRVINAGADEIYCDVVKTEIKDFSLYRGTLSEIPSYEELEKIVKYAHSKNVNVFIATNIPFITNGIEKAMKKHIRTCSDYGVDGFIIGELGILSLIKEMNIKTKLIASSYTEAMNYKAVSFLERIGFERVILERHLTIREISEIVRNSNIEVEIMIHGSGCSNINGNCYLYHYSFPEMKEAFSEVIDLKYPCTIFYDVYNLNNNKMICRKQILDAYTFCSICKLPELVSTGVSGFKIVGRELNEVYQETTTRIYRELLKLIKEGNIEAYNEKVNFFRDNFLPFPPALPTIREFFCEYKRCYFGELFNSPYKLPASLKIWTKFRFESMVFEK
jgi:putative protease